MSADVFGIVGTTQAGMFRVERVVAEGGFAVVYRAYHEGFRSPVALKCLKVPDAMGEEQRAAFLERFREEGELLFRLSALVPAVVRPLHVDVLVLQDGRVVPFLALEWLEGEGLDQIVEKRRAQGKPPIDVRKLVAFLQPAAHAFARAHRLPGPDGPIVVVHRDIKPENIFVAEAQGAELVKILDFGIARTRSAAALDVGVAATSGALDAFTPGYAAPEQWMPLRYGQVGPWTDVFCLALTMVEVLTGAQPITGDLRAMGEQTVGAARPTPRALGAAVTDDVERAFARALAVDPRERTRSIAAFWSELEVALGLPPSLEIADAQATARALTGASEPPPSLPMGPTSARTLAPTQQAPPGPGKAASPPTSGLRRPDGDAPAPARAAAEAPAIAFELAASPRSAPAPIAAAAPTPLAVAAPPPKLAPRPFPAHPRTMAPDRTGQRDLASLRERLEMPVKLVAAAIALTVADLIYTHTTGDIFTVASHRPVWITAPLAVVGVGLACWRIFGAL
jgi:eukaryotic-like serine/threonine-protein kinase